jgi:hypothetical protein
MHTVLINACVNSPAGAGNRGAPVWLLLGWLSLMPHSGRAALLGEITGFDQDGCALIVACGTPKVRIEAWSDDVVRIWLCAEGTFNYYDPAGTFMIEPGLRHFNGPTNFSVTDCGARLELRTGVLTVLIDKAPFGFAIAHTATGKVLARTPPGLSLDTDVRLYLERDVGGETEHFFGLGHPHGPVRTLDRRDEVVTMVDGAGHGWPAPFMISTRGYALFFHNEHGEHVRFSLTDPICVESMAAQGQADCFFMYGPDIPRLLDRFTDLTGKPPMPPRRLLGLQYLVQGAPRTDEGAFPDWIARNHSIDSCITFTDAQVETDDEIATVATTAQRIHALDGLFGFYLDFPYAPGTFRISAPEPRSMPYTNWMPFKTLLSERLLAQGVDWFWIDETDCSEAWNPPRFRHKLYEAITEAVEAFDGRRPLMCARGGYAGSQRYAYPWMGDLAFFPSTVLANLSNGLIGNAYATHDMAGAGTSGQTPTRFLNGVKASLLHPFSQCNNWIPYENPSHRPWEWPAPVEEVFRKFNQFHYQLIPYFYGSARQAHTTGLPVWRPLLLEAPCEPRYHTNDQVLIGDWLMMAPLYDRSQRNLELPPGRWRYFFADREFTGPLTLTNFVSPIDEYPLFLRAGAIVPMMPAMRHVDERPCDLLTLLIYPAAQSTATLYEDDGHTRDYLQGGYSTTLISCVTSNERVLVNVGPRTGSYPAEERGLRICVLAPSAPQEVRVNGSALPRVASESELAGSGAAWHFGPYALTGGNAVQVSWADGCQPLDVEIIPPRSEAVFHSVDFRTAGNWLGAYGSQGFLIPGLETNVPVQTALTTDGQPFIWNHHTTSTNALQRPGQAGCLAACVFGELFNVDVSTGIDETRLVGFYFLDWDGGGGRRLTVTASSPASGYVHDTRRMEGFQQGTYLTYEIGGSVRFQFRRDSGANACLSGIFLDPVVTPFESWQRHCFGDPTLPTATADADPDGDGLSNWSEFLAGTHPVNPSSVFQLTSARRDDSGLLLTWTTAGGRTNLVQVSQDPSRSGFFDLGSPVVLPPGGDLTTNFLDAGVLTNSGPRFYRIRLHP